MTTLTFNKLDFVDEEGRADIYHWSERRQQKYKRRYQKSLYLFRIFAFDYNLLRSFMKNFNVMVVLQMLLAGLVTYGCKSWNIVYDVHVTLFVSPIVFPLAFSINTDFQRREKVLEDLANFKSSAMMWFFCLRDWRESCCLDSEYMKAVSNKIRGLLFHLREYLMTNKIDRRNYILRVIYEDLSDANQLNEKVRCSKLPANSPLVARITHLLNGMCHSFERLRVIREYRSPRSIRSFTKVLIFALPLLLSPYYVYLGSKPILIHGVKVNNEWSPYYISIMVAFVFGALQGVQDKLDDPFDGMSEDDINLDTLDEWTAQSLEATAFRTYKVGRFQVFANPDKTTVKPTIIKPEDQIDGPSNLKRMFTRQPSQNMKNLHPFKSPLRSARSVYSDEEPANEDFESHPYAGVLSNIQGNTTILRGGMVKPKLKSYDDLQSLNNTITSADNNKVFKFNQVIFGGENSSQVNKKNSVSSPIQKDAPGGIFTLFQLPKHEIVEESSFENTIINPLANSIEIDSPTGIQSYIAALNKSRSSSVASNGSKRLRRNSAGSNSSLSSNNIKNKFFLGNDSFEIQPQMEPKISEPRYLVNNLSGNSGRPLLDNFNNSSENSEVFSSSEDEQKFQQRNGRFIMLNQQQQSPPFQELKDGEIFI